MSPILVLSGLLVSAAPLPPVETIDAAYEEVAANRSADAIARIEGNGPAAHAHPAQLINLGIAYARAGDKARARQLFRRAANAEEVYSLETHGGGWTNSRVLARQALASLGTGRLGQTVRTARR